MSTTEKAGTIKNTKPERTLAFRNSNTEPETQEHDRESIFAAFIIIIKSEHSYANNFFK